MTFTKVKRANVRNTERNHDYLWKKGEEQQNCISTTCLLTYASIHAACTIKIASCKAKNFACCMFFSMQKPAILKAVK